MWRVAELAESPGVLGSTRGIRSKGGGPAGGRARRALGTGFRTRPPWTSGRRQVSSINDLHVTVDPCPGTDAYGRVPDCSLAALGSPVGSILSDVNNPVE